MDVPDLPKLMTPFAPFDRADLAASIGALQLLPENASLALRLQIAAAAVCRLPVEINLPCMNNNQWLKAVNNVPVRESSQLSLDTPSEGPFTEAFTFHGGSFVVFPGLEPEDPYILARTADAIFRVAEAFTDVHFEPMAYRLFRAVLVLSDAMASKAGLSRNVAPRQSAHGNVVVPPSDRFEALKRAVTFTTVELQTLLLASGLGLSDLDVFISDQGASEITYPPPSAHQPVPIQPILRHQDHYVVIVPSALLALLRHHVVGLAIGRGALNELSARYHSATVQNVNRSITQFLGCRPLPLPQFDHRTPAAKSGFFELDRDKVLHAVVLTDPITEYDIVQPWTDWTMQGLVDHIVANLPEIERSIFSNAPPGSVNEVLHLIIVQGVGRFHRYIIQSPQEDTSPYRLSLSAGELEVLGFRVGGFRLALWQFGEAHKNARASTKVISGGLLDEFEYYQAHGNGYFEEDRSRPDVLRIPHGCFGRLRREVLQQFDIHAISDPVSSHVVDVGRLNSDVDTPSYLRLSPSDNRIAVLSEALSIPVWFLSPNEMPDSAYGGLYHQFAQMLAFWISEFSPSLSELAVALGDYLEKVIVEIQLVPSPAWFSAQESDPPPGPNAIRCAVEGDVLVLVITAGAFPLLQSEENSGEREILRVLLLAFSSLVDEHVEPDAPRLSKADIAAMIDRHAPLGPKKMIHFLDSARDPRLGGRNVELVRLVQSAETHAVRDELGAFLTRKADLSVGALKDDRRGLVLNQAVDYLFFETERLVASLSIEGLLEDLVSLNEALIHRQTSERFTITSQIACFSNVPAMVKALSRRMPDVSDALVSSRFLIEYVSARPPHGLRPFCLAVYDRLLCLASEIITLAFASDVVARNLANVRVALLPSGRLEMTWSDYDDALNQLAIEYAFGEIGRRRDEFELRAAGQMDQQLVDGSDVLDGPAKLEFGFSFRELLSFLEAVMIFGDRQTRDSKSATLPDFENGVADILGWAPDHVCKARELFMARPRDRYLDPPSPYKKLDAYPWNFARRLSYLRKPLLLRTDENELEEIVWGNRNIYMAGMYLWGLCSTGRFEARTKAMKVAMSQLQQREAQQFNDAVAAAFSALPGAIVKKQVVQVGGQRIVRTNGQTLGDIDVLVVEPKRRLITLAEAKNLAPARTPWEFSQELEEIYKSMRGKKSTVDKHLERSDWVHSNRAALLSWLNLNANSVDNWVVQPLLVLDKETASPYLASSPITTTSLQQLKDDIRTGRWERD